MYKFETWVIFGLVHPSKREVLHALSVVHKSLFMKMYTTLYDCKFYVCYFYEQWSIADDVPVCKIFGHNTYSWRINATYFAM